MQKPIIEQPKTETKLTNISFHASIVRENRRGNQEVTIQRHRQHWPHKTQDEDQQI